MSIASTRSILEKVRDRRISITRAEKFLRLNALSVVDDIARIDINRHLRRGVPEIVYAEGKTTRQLESIIEKLLAIRTNGLPAVPLVISRISKGQFETIQNLFRTKIQKRKGIRLRHFESARIVAFSFESKETLKEAGRVGLLAAGTSDIAILDEAEAILSLMGCETLRFNDVGVASLARLREPLKKLQLFDPDAIIVAAGMEAALPSVIAGLSSVPVIGLPTSIGFGYGGMGEAALMSILQACPLGIAAVNIDGGVAAGVIASLISRRCSEARSQISKSHLFSNN
jgi:pyridinium-3,5-biscarboxylic acid mononucleotide synthase